MSPSWRDHLQIVLCPDRVVLVRFGRGLQPVVKDRTIAQCGESAGAPLWRPALETLQRLLADPQWQNARARVLLSNHFVHYLLIDWDEELSGHDEQLAMVRLSFARVYGDESAAWDYRWSEGHPPSPCLACGMEHGLFGGLMEIFTDAGLELRLEGVQPYLMAAFNHWRHELDGHRDWFLLAEPGRLCLSWFKNNEWAGLHSQQIGSGWGADLPAILERSLLLAGMSRPPERLCIHAPETPELGLTLGEGWSGSVFRLHAVPGFSPADDGAYAMAMNT